MVKGGGVDGIPPLSFRLFAVFLEVFTSFDLLYKLRYILWVVALLGAYDVTKHGRHLGLYQILEIR